MKIAVLGPGGIGSTFAFKLAQAGHDVTVVARGERLAQLERDGAIVLASGERAPVVVRATLDEATAWDLVLVTVLAHQVDVVLPALTASAARSIMFMFNTFETFDRLRAAVGAERFTFGFPAILATFTAGRLTTQIVTKPMSTTVTDAGWARVFTAAGIFTVQHPDMESWLRTHAALVVPMMIAAVRSYERQAGISWREARGLAYAMEEGLTLVGRLGNTITPGPMVVIDRLPLALKAALMWATSRQSSVRKTGAAGYAEPRALIDAMEAAAPGQVPTLMAVRP